MADNAVPNLPAVTPERRRIANAQFERAKQVLLVGNYDYAIQLLLTCCKMDPANLTYRTTLRQTEKTKFKDATPGAMGRLAATAVKVKLKAARQVGDYLGVLEHGEEVLTRNPWDAAVQMEMAQAADALGLLDLAIWIMLQAREKQPMDVHLNRYLAQLCEKRGNFGQAMLLWEMIRKVQPKDEEAQHKSKELAASNTIAQGGYAQAATGESGGGVAVASGLAAAARAAAPSQAERPSQEATTLRANITAHPTNPDGYLHLATFHRRAGRAEEARKVLMEGLLATHHHADLALALESLEIDALRRDLALREKQSDTPVEDSGPSCDDLRRQIVEREIALYRQRVERYPSEKTYRLELGVRLLRAGQVQEAIAHFQAVRTDARFQWRALMYLGQSFKSAGHWRLAQGNFEEALKKLPSQEDEARKEILLELALGHAESGDLHKAIEWGYELANRDFLYGNIGQRLDEWQTQLKSGTA
jgi:tetratricopeptide (TPR) repeat protein